MKILLVYPEYPRTFFSFKHALGILSKKAFFPPLGLLTIAAMLPQEWEKRLVDTNVRALEDSDIAWADMVFISAMIVQKKSAKEIIGRCRALGKKVVAGGPVFTTQHEQFEGVDHFVLNEAEVTLPQTRLWHRLKAEGRLLSDTTGEHTDGSLDFMPKMGREKLIAGYKKIISTIYSPKRYCQRIDAFIKNYRPTARNRISKQDICAFLKSLWRIGILSEARLLYWEVILKTAFTKARALPAAIELAVLWPDFKKFSAALISGSRSSAA